MPRLSVIMPVYNGDKYISQAIESILKQSFADYELLVINDGSSDRSIDIVEDYADKRIRIIHNESNLGLAATRNIGIENARGEYIAMLDCDDIAHPDRLALQVEFLDRNPDYVLVGTWVKIIDESGRIFDEWEYPLPAEKIPCLLLFQNYFAQSAVCLRREMLPEVMYREEYPPAEDYDLWVRIAKKGKVWNLPRYLVSYRSHSEGASKIKKDLGEKSVREIISNQLNVLGLSPSSEEIMLHRSVGEVISKNWNLTLLKELENWLNKLREANNYNNIFPSELFDEILFERWHLACLAATSSVKSVFDCYWSSDLKKISPRTYIRGMRFLIRSCTGFRSR